MNQTGVIVIGRNEGVKLIRCFDSIDEDATVVYVDSGSQDNSVAHALAAGAIIVELDTALPFTAARARNAGRVALPTNLDFIQFVDGDCELQPGWLDAGRTALQYDLSLGAVFGMGRERQPRATIYNWLCDLEWKGRPGPAYYFGGIVMFRAEAIDDACGYSEQMIAGEEPDLAIRIRQSGWQIQRLSNDMMVHDADISFFSQWWSRATRSGFAYADLAARHGGDYRLRLYKASFWGGIPIIFLAAIIFGLSYVAAFALSLIIMQFARLVWRERSRGHRDALTLAAFLMLAKPAQAIGAIRYWFGRATRRRSQLIEYKSAA